MNVCVCRGRGGNATENETRIIALAGKGGVGKTSLSAAFVRLLAERRPGARILAVDADPAVGLSTALGVEVRETLEQQIAYNTAISDEGLANDWGAGVGKALLKYCGQDIRVRIKAAAAAGSDARMSGCTLPVVINSGSGNQGITVSMPVILYARHIGAGHDKLLRALCVSNMMAIHQKTGIGRLSAFCGAVSAATGAACGIAWLDGAGYDVIAQTITNSLANVGGMVCDGAKASCAAKIASSLESALLGYELAKEQRGFRDGEGIVKSDVEKTIASVGRMAAMGMHSTDQEILHIMVDA